jgi:hypothetical protein
MATKLLDPIPPGEILREEFMKPLEISINKYAHFEDSPMDTGILAALIGIFAGAFGYWFTTFSVQPILKYRDLRNRVLAEFIYYAQVTNAKGLNEEMQNLQRERELANRKTSAKLSAAILDLPRWYLWYLKKWKGLAPAEAASHLIGFANTTDYDQAHKIQGAIRRKLGLPPET